MNMQVHWYRDKLKTDADIRAIKIAKEYNNGVTVRELVRKYGVARQTIHRLIKRASRIQDSELILTVLSDE